MARAVIFGGTGTIGRAVAARLLDAGWQVDATGRDAGHVPEELAGRAGFSFLLSERRDASAVRAAIAGGAELVVDCVCFSEADALLIAPFLADVDATVMLSSKAVYVDEFGHHANSLVRPVFPVPVPEDGATVAPDRGDGTTRDGYGAGKVAAENVLLDSGLPVTVLRAGKVHGPGTARPREWAFLKRAIDGREQLALAHEGRGGDHTAAAANIATLVEAVASAPGARILNAADPDAPSGLDIARAVAAHAGHHFEYELLEDDVDPRYGAHPWDVVPPMVLDLGAARSLGWEPAGTYAATVGAELDWLLREHELGRTAVFDEAPFFAPYLDYPLEDAFLLLRNLQKRTV